MTHEGKLKIKLVQDTERLRVWEHQGTSKRLVICFSGIGPDEKKPPEFEFAETAAGGGKDWVLYIADPKRTWLNGPGLIDQIVSVIERYAARMGAMTICSLGHSMGGYSALALPGFTKVDVALGLSPQVSVHPDVVPDDPRWMNWREQISEYRVRHIADHLANETQYFAIFGRHPREAPQRGRFPVAENIETLVMAKTHHNTAARLRRAGLLQTVVEAAFSGRKYRVRRLIRRNFGDAQNGAER